MFLLLAKLVNPHTGSEFHSVTTYLRNNASLLKLNGLIIFKRLSIKATLKKADSVHLISSTGKNTELSNEKLNKNYNDRNRVGQIYGMIDYV